MHAELLTDFQLLVKARLMSVQCHNKKTLYFSLFKSLVQNHQIKSLKIYLQTSRSSSESEFVSSLCSSRVKSFELELNRSLDKQAWKENSPKTRCRQWIVIIVTQCHVPTAGRWTCWRRFLFDFIKDESDNQREKKEHLDINMMFIQVK